VISIDETFVDSAAPNPSAISNGKGLVRKGKLLTRHKDADETIIFGEIKGSGRSNYHTSVDFSDPSNPVYRCSCPSRQFPCKHTLGLMYAWVLGETFVVAEVPTEIVDKRARAEARATKRKERAARPRRVDKRALAKKLDAQLEGLDVLERMTEDLVRGGLGSLDPKTARTLEEKAKQLGNAFLPGAQKALRSLTILFAPPDVATGQELAERYRETIYTEALDRLTRLQMICRRGREYLEARKADPELAPDTETPIAAWLGHAWQLTELHQHGLFEENGELVQLYFGTRDDPAREEWVDVGVWANLGRGTLQRTLNLRPYRAARFIKEDDCFFRVRTVPALYRYPGGLDPRIRWDEAGDRALTPDDIAAIRGFARPLAETLKRVKNHLKDPLGHRHPHALVAYRRIGRVDDRVVLEDAEGARIALVDDPAVDPFDTVPLLPLVDPALREDQVALLAFLPDLDDHALRAKPLTLVGERAIVRLAL